MALDPSISCPQSLCFLDHNWPEMAHEQKCDLVVNSTGMTKNNEGALFSWWDAVWQRNAGFKLWMMHPPGKLKIVSGPECNFIWDNMPTKAILNFVLSTWLIASELAIQHARKVLFTCVVYTNINILTCLRGVQHKLYGGVFSVSKSLLGNERWKKLKKITVSTWKPQSYDQTWLLDKRGFFHQARLTYLWSKNHNHSDCMLDFVKPFFMTLFSQRRTRADDDYAYVNKILQISLKMNFCFDCVSV